jgi:peptide/nickel transport system substrate-binding protein
MCAQESSRITRRFFLKLGAGGIAAVMLDACGQSPTAAPTAAPPAQPTAQQATLSPTPTTMAQKKGGRFTMIAHWEPVTLDVHKTVHLFAELVGLNVYETLVFHDPESGKYLPYLAESWETTADGLNWTFKLRQDVVFHDGTPFNAQAVKRSFDRILDPATAAGPALGHLGGKLLQNVSAPDDNTIQLQYSAPFAPLLAGLSLAFTGIISPAALDKYGDDISHNPVGTGPFVFKEWIPNEHILFTRNEEYNWAPSSFTYQGPPLLDEFQWLGIPEVTTRMVAYEKGEGDMVYAPLSQYQNLMAGPYNTMRAPVPGLGWALYMNVAKPPLDDLKVRQAVAHAVDREGMLNAPFLGGATIAEFGPLTSATLGYDPTLNDRVGYAYDPEKAKQLLDEAGWTPGADGIREKDGTRLQLAAYTETENIVPPTEAIQAFLKEVGIEVNIVSLEAAAAKTAFDNGEHNLTIEVFTGTDPNIMYQCFHSTSIGNWNVSHVTNPELDALLDKGATTVNPDERVPIYIQAQEIVLKEAYSVPMYNLMRIFSSYPYVKDIKWTDRAWPIPYQQWLDK